MKVYTMRRGYIERDHIIDEIERLVILRVEDGSCTQYYVTIATKRKGRPTTFRASERCTVNSVCESPVFTMRTTFNNQQVETIINRNNAESLSDVQLMHPQT